MAGLSEPQKKWAKIVAKAWADEGYKAKLLADPAGVLAAEGLAPPPGVRVRIVEAGPDETVLVLPQQNPSASVQEQEGRLAAFPFSPIF